MGALEKSVKVQIRKSKINSSIISAAAVSGGIALAVLAPSLLSTLGRTKYLKQRRYQLKSSFSRLVAAGYIASIARPDAAQPQRVIRMPTS